MAENLTLERIKNAVCPADKKQAFLRDKEVPQLAVRITAGGAKSYVFESKLNAESVRLTIGKTSTLTLDSKKPAGARQIARSMQAMVDEGRDPRQVKAERTAADTAARAEARRKDYTGLEAWAAYIEARSDKWGQRHKEDHIGFAAAGGVPFTKGKQIGKERVTQDGLLRSLLSRPLSEIDADAVGVWAAKNVKKRPARVRLAVTLLQTFLRWCAKQPEYKGANPEAASEHKRDLPKQQSQNDLIEREQLRLWFDAVGKMPSKTIAAYLKIVLLTGARREELARMKWADVDFEWDSLTLRDKATSKGGQDGKRTIAMTPHIRALLLELKTINETRPEQKVKKLRGDDAPAKAWKPSPFVFPSQRAKSGTIGDPLHPMQAALQEVGLPHLTIHGLRRSFATLCEWVGMPEPISSQIQGHKPTTVREKHYKRRPLSLLRVWQTKFEEFVLTEAGVAVPTEGIEHKPALTAIQGGKA